MLRVTTSRGGAQLGLACQVDFRLNTIQIMPDLIPSIDISALFAADSDARSATDQAILAAAANTGSSAARVNGVPCPFSTRRAPMP